MILPRQGKCAPAISELWSGEAGADSKGEGGEIVLGPYEGLRETAAQKVGDVRRFFLARLKPCPDERHIEERSLVGAARAAAPLSG